MKAGHLGDAGFLRWLFCLVFLDPLPQPHLIVLCLCFFPASRIPQRQLDHIIGKLGHGDFTLLGLVVQGADDETGQGRGVVGGSGHSPFRCWSLMNEPSSISLYQRENELRRTGLLGLPR